MAETYNTTVGMMRFDIFMRDGYKLQRAVQGGQNLLQASNDKYLQAIYPNLRKFKRDETPMHK